MQFLSFVILSLQELTLVHQENLTTHFILENNLHFLIETFHGN